MADDRIDVAVADMRLDSDAMAHIEAMYVKSIQAMEYFPKYLAAVTGFVRELSEENMENLRRIFKSDQNADYFLDITPEKINKHVTAAGLPALDDNQCGKINMYLVKQLLRGEGLEPCDVWELCHGLQHLTQENLGIGESRH